jgi:uncharacterized membrane protein
MTGQTSTPHLTDASTPVTRGRGKAGWVAVLLTALAVAVYFPGQYVGGLQAAADAGRGALTSTYLHDSPAIRAAFYTHISTAGLALLVGPLQFSAALRRRAPQVHRWIGRTYVVGVGLGSVAAFIMSFVSSVALLGFFGYGTLALLWGWTTYRGYRSVRSGRIPEHRAWMIRSFALTYAAVTLRAWLILFIIALNVFAGDHLSAAQIYTMAYAPVPFLCWLPNIVFAELLIRRRGLPGLRFTTPSPERVSSKSA